MVELYSIKESAAVEQLLALTDDLRVMAQKGEGRLTFLDPKNLPFGQQVGILDVSAGFQQTTLFDLHFLYPVKVSDFNGRITISETLLYKYSRFGAAQFSRPQVTAGQLARPDEENGYERKFFAQSGEANQIKSELERLLAELESIKTVRTGHKLRQLKT